MNTLRPITQKELDEKLQSIAALEVQIAVLRRLVEDKMRELGLRWDAMTAKDQQIDELAAALRRLVKAAGSSEEWLWNEGIIDQAESALAKVKP